jgi:Cu-processing system permease protein
MVRAVGRIYAIALNAYREAIRDRVLFGVLGLALASLLFGSSLAWISLNEQVRILVDHGIVTISWLSNLVAIFLGASFLYKEIELRTLYVILAKPVTRWEFVLGKYFGIVGTAWVFIALTASMLLVLLNLQTAEAQGPTGAGFASLAQQIQSSRKIRFGLLTIAITAVLLGSWVARKVPPIARIRQSLGAAITMVLSLALLTICAFIALPVAPVETRFVLLSTLLIAGEVLLTAAIATVFSSFSTPFVTGMLSLGMFLIGRTAGVLLELRSRFVPVELRALLRNVAAVLPNLQLFVPSRWAIAPAGDDSTQVYSYLAHAISYSVLYAGILLAIAARVFRRRDLV